MKITTRSAAPLIALILSFVASSTASAQEQSAERLSPQRKAEAYSVLNDAIAFLRAQQDTESGGWTVRPDGVTFPAITALVIDGMLQHPAIDATDPAVARGIDYLLSHRQPDGGIYDRVLPSYNTAIALSALARAGIKPADAAIPDAQRFLIGLQWSEDSLADEISERLGVGRVGPEHPFYGGVGYGSHGRPDLSNTSFMLQALHDSGYDPDSPPFQRALVFLQRVQMDERVNDMPYAAGSTDGGFIYATGPEADQLGVGQSQAGTIEETLDDGTVVSRLRSYGSMTYTGFKSYVYADLPRDDPRVTAARGWISRHYTLDENPGLGEQGYYYYIVAFARALDAWGEPTLEVSDDESTAETEPRPWADDLLTRLAALQQEDGSFRVLNDRWLENDPVLITAYGVIALQAALDND